MTSETFQLLKASGRLQPLSPAGTALLNLQKRGEAIDSEVIEAIDADPALSELILRLINESAADSSTERVFAKSVADCDPEVVRLVGVAFALVLTNRVGICENFDYDRFWSVSLARAVAAKVLSAELSIGQPAEAFVYGILSGIGRIALASVYPREYSGLQGMCPVPSREELLRLEQGLFRIDHLETTEAMLADYGFPAEIGEAILSADSPASSGDHDGLQPGIAGLLQVGHMLEQVFLEDPSSPQSSWYELMNLRQQLRLDRESFNTIGDRIAEEWGEWGDLLRIPTKPVLSFSEIALREAALKEMGELPDSETPVAEPVAQETEQKLRILAVDDDPMTLRLLGRHLELGGHHVFTARDGREALLSALHNDPHVVVADWMMPEMDGIELCKALRRFDAGRRIFFMLLTGREEEEKVVEAFEAGVDDFVSKPFRSKLLLARVRASQRVVALQRQIEVDKRLLREHLAEKSALTRKLRAAAFTDVLTELPNRRYAIKRLHEEWANSDRRSTPLSVIMIDIDHFKKVNDAHGHDVGDVVLRETAAVLDACTREGDSACRLGGEEFLIICTGSGLDAAAQIGERIRASVEENLIDEDSFSGNVTVSVGVATRSIDVVDLDNLLKLADEAVYEAKAKGRNQVVTWSPKGEMRDAG